MGDKFARQSHNLVEEHISFGHMVKLCCYYTTKYDIEVGIHAGEQLIFENNLITRLANALNG